jgi:DNA-binding NarL/FixJ family response regulator
MVTEKIKQLQALQAKAKELQDSIEAERTQELASLPERYGYDSIAGFVKALKDAAEAKPARGRRPGKPGRPAKAAAAKPAGKKRTRAKITSETKAQVKSLVEAGKTGAQIAKEVGISLPSVQNIKKELGLVKARSS